MSFDSSINQAGACICTTNGVINAHDITGILVHEHVFNKYPFRFREKSERFTISELDAACSNGINVIVDLTPYTNPYDYYRVIDETSINIITCTGFYTPRYMAPRVNQMTTAELLTHLSKKIENGVGIRKIKPAILKVAVQKDAPNDTELRFLQAVARTSRQYSMPVALHAPFSTYEHAKQLLDLGVSPNLLMVAHIENGISEKGELAIRTTAAKKLASLGCYIQLADFGAVLSTAKCRNALTMVDSIINAGYVDNLLISSDSNWRWRNAEPVLRNSKNGSGRHYTYSITHTLPLISERIGIDMRNVLLLNNPLRFLRLL